MGPWLLTATQPAPARLDRLALASVRLAVVLAPDRSRLLLRLELGGTELEEDLHPLLLLAMRKQPARRLGHAEHEDGEQYRN